MGPGGLGKYGHVGRTLGVRVRGNPDWFATLMLSQVVVRGRDCDAHLTGARHA